jgi:hypothetical protein
MGAAFLMLVGAIGAIAIYRHEQPCIVDKTGLEARTVVCSDGQAYGLIPLLVDVRILRRQLSECHDQVQQLGGTVPPNPDHK